MAKNEFVDQEVEERDEVCGEHGGEHCGQASDANVADGGDTESDKVADETGAASQGAPDAAASQEEAEGEETKAEVSAEELVEQWKDKYLRLQAEFDNFRKRTLREKMDLVQSGGSDVLKSILPVLDDVLRAVEASEKSDDIKSLREGERLVAQKFIDALRQKNVIEIEAVGQDFDPDLHEAVAKFAAGEEKKGKVIDVVQRGYKLGDKVLRFAKVVVGE